MRKTRLQVFKPPKFGLNKLKGDPATAVTGTNVWIKFHSNNSSGA